MGSYRKVEAATTRIYLCGVESREPQSAEVLGRVVQICRRRFLLFLLFLVKCFVTLDQISCACLPREALSLLSSVAQYLCELSVTPLNPWARARTTSVAVSPLYWTDFSQWTETRRHARLRLYFLDAPNVD